MMTADALFSLWGCGRGPLRLASPQARVLSAVLLGCACLAVPLREIGGAALALSAAACWWALAGMPLKITVRCCIASLVLFAPFLLLTPWMTVEPGTDAPLLDRLVNAGTIALRSACCLFVAASAAASVPLHEVHEAAGRLPLPKMAAAIVIQIIMQTMLLAEETLRVIAALRLRAATGIRSARVLFAFPVVWMVRILFRAERTAAAMTVRGYGIGTQPVFGRMKAVVPDTIITGAAVAVLAAAVLMRLGVI